MQVLPAEPETAECCPRPVSLVKTTASVPDTVVTTTLPSWGTLPSARRRRLVAVLGDLVQRTRKECVDER